MSNSVGYCVRLKVRIGKGLTTDETSLSAKFSGREVTVKSAKQDQPLKEASWLVIGARGFATKSEANEYGEDLRRATHLAGLCTLVGMDGRAMDDDRTNSHITAAGEEWLRSLGRLQPDQSLVPDIHGLTVLPDDENVLVAGGGATVRVAHGHDPTEFVRAIEEAAAKGVSQGVVQAISVLNLAQINDSPTAKVVLAISSIEALAVQGEGWTASQRKTIDQAINWVHSEFGDSDAVHEVTDAIQRMHQHSLRQQAKRLLRKHNLLTWWSDWEDVYGRRSGLFHGGASREEGNVVELARDAVKVCGRIVLSIAKRQGAVLPTAAQVHFGVRQGPDD